MWPNTGAFILGYRIGRNLTQQELATRLGVSKQFVSRIENGRAGLPWRCISLCDWDRQSLLEVITKDFYLQLAANVE